MNYPLKKCAEGKQWVDTLQTNTVCTDTRNQKLSARMNYPSKKWAGGRQRVDSTSVLHVVDTFHPRGIWSDTRNKKTNCKAKPRSVFCSVHKKKYKDFKEAKIFSCSGCKLVFRCHICDKNLTSRQGINSHYRRFHKKDPDSDDENRENMPATDPLAV